MVWRLGWDALTLIDPRERVCLQVDRHWARGTKGLVMIEASGQRQPLHAAQVMEFGALKISCERDGDVYAICPSGELDLSTARHLQRELERLEALDPRSILLDLSGLTFIDSTGVRLLLSAHARSRDSDRLTMLRGSTAVERVLQLTGVAELLPFSD